MQTFGVDLASGDGAPLIGIPVPGATGQVLTLQPACRNAQTGDDCALVDFRVVQPHTVVDGVATGRFVVTWDEDGYGAAGSDFDLDLSGLLGYRIARDAEGLVSLTVTTG